MQEVRANRLRRSGVDPWQRLSLPRRSSIVYCLAPLTLARVFATRTLPRTTVLAIGALLLVSPATVRAQHSMAGMHQQITVPDGANYTVADVEFMQGMIAHHAQAIVMSRMAESNGANPQVLKLSRKIDQSQVPEIVIMQEWLRRHGQFAPDTASWHGMRMDGMLTDDELKAMSEAKGVAFDRLFLVGMIKHHAGALKMVDDLFKSPGAGQEVDANVFANDVVTSQTAEIGIMRRLLSQLP